MKHTARYIFMVLMMLSFRGSVDGQVISSSIPVKVSVNGKYLFYQHAGLVSELGDNAINQSVPEWGSYEYSNILDSLQKQGFDVISEIRPKEFDDSVFVNKISKQIDSLLKAGVRPERIMVVGASSGWNITLGVSSKLMNKEIKYVILGGCRPEYYKDYLHTELYGRFLSIIEASDPHGTCYMIFENRKHLKSYREIVLHTGLSHGFIYKGRHAWIDPMVNWFDDNK